MTQRLRGITDEEASGPTKDLFDASNVMLGRIANLQRILSHSPLVARWFLAHLSWKRLLVVALAGLLLNLAIDAVAMTETLSEAFAIRMC